MRKLLWLIGIAALLGSGAYVFIYLARWEFHRTLIVAAFFLAAEIGLAAAMILRRIGQLEAKVQAVAPPQPNDLIRQRLRETAPQRNHFAWMQPQSGQLNVFIPVLLGAGVVVSGAAWVVEKLAARNSGGEEELARRLSAIAFPRDGLVPDDAELLAQEGPYADDPQLRLLLGPTGAGERH